MLRVEVVMAIQNVELTEHFEAFVEAGVESGRFRDASEVLREGLRLLEQRDREDAARLEWLRGAAKEGFDQLDRGESIEFASIDAFDAYTRQVALEVAGEVSAQRG